MKIRSKPEPGQMRTHGPSPTAKVEELRKAFQRIGHTPRDRMKWTLKFAQRDLTTLSDGDWLNLAFEVAAFTRFGMLGEPVFTRGSELFGSLHDPIWANFLGPVAVPTQEEITGLQASTKQKITHLAVAKATAVELGNTSLRVYPFGKFGGIVHVVTELPSGRFNYVLAHLLADHLGRLRRCPECGLLFLADRRNQRYNSVRCQNRAASRRFRATPPERIGKRGRPRKTPEQRKEETRRRRAGHSKRQRRS